MHIEESISEESIYAKKIASAFVAWCKMKEIDQQQLAYDIIREKRKKSTVHRGTFRNLFPWNEGLSYHRHINDNPTSIRTFLDYIFEITEASGCVLQREKRRLYDLNYDVPCLDHTGRFMSIASTPEPVSAKTPEPDPPTFYLYYYSNTKDDNSIKKLSGTEDSYHNFETGGIYIDKKDLEKSSGNALVTLGDPKVKFRSEWWHDESNVYYGIDPVSGTGKATNNKNTRHKARFPINFVFKKHKRYAKMNFYVGVYSSAWDDDKLPCCGLVIAVKAKGVNQDDEDMKACLHYLLRHKKLKEKPDFRYPIQDNNDLDKVSEQAKIWYQDIRKARGTYACYFSDPYLQKFIKGYMNMAKDGTVYLYTKHNHDDAPYIGVLKKINNRAGQNNLIISLDFHKEEYEYRVRIFLSKSHFKRNRTLLGVYSALQFGEFHPFSSLFAACQIQDMSLQEIKTKIEEGEDNEMPGFERLIKKESDYKDVLAKLQDQHVKKFFSPQKGFAMHSIALQIPSEL